MEHSDPSIVADFDLSRPPLARALIVVGPSEPLSTPAGEDELVLAVGLNAGTELAQAEALIVAAAGSAGVILRRPTAGDRAQRIEQAAGRAGVPLYWLADSVSWSQAHRAVSESLTPQLAGDDELADLAQTIATLTGGLVTIEDTSSRVLAYSRSSDEVDDLRRLSILGRSGPAQYLSLLRQWGVYDRLAASEEVVEIAEHPESGVRRRLAVGIFAGPRQLGTIWVQQGAQDFPPHAAQALLGAARVTAAQLVEHRRIDNRNRTGRSESSRALSNLLAGRPTGGQQISARAARQPCAVAVFDLGSASANGDLGGDAGVDVGGADNDRAARGLAMDDLGAIVTLHAVALRRGAMAEVIGDRLYLLLPALTSLDAAIPALRAAVAAGRRHLRPTVRCALGPLVDSMAAAARSRAGADLALGCEPAPDGLTRFIDARAGLAVGVALEALRQRPDLLEDQLLRMSDEEPELAHTLLQFLNSGSQVASTAAALGIHATSVRHRLRRVVHFTGLDLDDPDQRLAAHLQLRTALRSPR
jgi:DNA-binding PucR family transcriptional regulator